MYMPRPSLLPRTSQLTSISADCGYSRNPQNAAPSPEQLDAAAALEEGRHLVRAELVDCALGHQPDRPAHRRMHRVRGHARPVPQPREHGFGKRVARGRGKAGRDGDGVVRGVDGAGGEVGEADPAGFGEEAFVVVEAADEGLQEALAGGVDRQAGRGDVGGDGAGEADEDGPRRCDAAELGEKSAREEEGEERVLVDDAEDPLFGVLVDPEGGVGTCKQAEGVGPLSTDLSGRTSEPPTLWKTRVMCRSL